MIEVFPDPPHERPHQTSDYRACVCAEVSSPFGARNLIRGPKASTSECAMKGLEDDVAEKLDLKGKSAAGDSKWLLDPLEEWWLMLQVPADFVE